jgi:peptidyl-prolyl cis-trans isomerase B (cyclophilin B)
MITTATFKMDKGDIIFRLLPEAPIHFNRFINNAKNGYFKNVDFHRVIPGFIAQSGPQGNDFPKSYMWDEIKEPRRKSENNIHYYGTLSGANTGKPHTDMGAFFVCLSRRGTKHLDKGHTVFGQVFKGWEFIENIKKGDIIKNVLIDSYSLTDVETIKEVII